MTLTTRMTASLATLVAVGLAGCRLTSPPVAYAPPEAIVVAGGSSEQVWERVVDVLQEYPFEIERENKLDGVIETKFKIGASLLEPWHRDSVGFYNRLESGLQSIRRKLFVNIQPDAGGGFTISVASDKQISNLDQPIANTPGGATFQDNRPLQRDLTATLGDRPPTRGWVSRGRDAALEADLMRRLRNAFGSGQ